MEKFNDDFMELKDYRLFIYDDFNSDMKSTIRKDYWKQIDEENNWVSLNPKYYNEISERGWFDEFLQNNKFISNDNFLMKKIEITEKHKNGIINFDDVEINYFIRFEMEIKNKFPVKMILYVDYEKGEVFVIKHIS